MSPIIEAQDNQRKNGLANILAIGTANPPQAITQSDYAEYYFQYTNCEHMTELKSKFKHICEKTTIKQRYMHGTKEMLTENPHMCDFNASSLDTRHALIGNAVPKLGSEAATKAIEEWGQPKSKITHLIFCTTVAFDIPGPDYELVRLLSLNDSVKRYMMCMQGCHAGGTVLRLAKDLAENTHGARVLVVCSEVMLVGFRGPTEGHLASMVAQSLFADGAGAVIVGAHPDESLGERPIFEMVSASQKLVPDTKGAIGGHLRETGLAMELKLNVPYLISTNIEKPLAEAFDPIGINDWNSIFWIVHPGGPPILAQIESKLGLNKSKLSTSFHVLKEFGNMSSASVLFILNETRKRSVEERKATTGDGLDYGVLFGLGPGVTIETIVLRSYPLNN